jgi:hypothetical protein
MDELAAGVFEGIDVLALVLQATREEGLQEGIVKVRTGPLSASLAKFQCRPVSAVQEVGEVRRRENEITAPLAHVLTALH